MLLSVLKVNTAFWGANEHGYFPRVFRAVISRCICNLNSKSGKLETLYKFIVVVVTIGCSSLHNFYSWCVHVLICTWFIAKVVAGFALLEAARSIDCRVPIRWCSLPGLGLLLLPGCLMGHLKTGW